MRRWNLLAVCMLVGIVGLGFPGAAMAKDKFEKEVEKEAGAIKLVREVGRGGYGVVGTAELKQWIDLSLLKAKQDENMNGGKKAKVGF